MKPQIATTPEQSKRLIACGVKPETADMSWEPMPGDTWSLSEGTCFHVEAVPAWSASSLLSILPYCLEGGYFLTIQKLDEGDDNERWGIAYMRMEYEGKNTRHTHSGGAKFAHVTTDLMTGLILTIEQLRAKNYRLAL